MAINLVQSLSSTTSVIANAGISGLDIHVDSELVSNESTETTEAGIVDSINKVNNSATAWNEFSLQSALGESVVYENLSPSTASLNGNRVGIVSNGGGVCIRATKGIASSIIRLNNANGIKKVTRFDTYAEGSISLELANNILSKMTSGKVMEFFTNYSNTQTGSQTSFTKNPDCWAHGYNMSGVAIDGNIFGVYSSANKGALITNQHLLGAAHWQYTYPVSVGPNDPNGGYCVGQSFRFRGEDGSIHTRQIIGLGRTFGDCVVATLDSPLPASVSPFKLAGDWQHRSQTEIGAGMQYYNGGAVFYLDQQFKARCMLGSTISKMASYTADYDKVGGGVISNLIFQSWFAATFQMAALEQSTLLAGKTGFCREAITGDSGAGIFYDTGTDIALVGTFYYPTWCHAIGAGNGEVANDLILRADLDAVAKGNLISPTGKTVVMAADPSI